MPRRSRRAPLRLPGFLAAVLILPLLLLNGCTSGSGSGGMIGSNFFGMHVHRLTPDPGTVATPWPNASFGSLRLWDSGTTWAKLQPTPTTWDFSKLDAQVDQARQHGASVLLVLGQTPTWASARPGQASGYGAGAGAEPKDFLAWQRYVQTVVERYRGRISAYEVWNEPVEARYYTGTPETLGRLTKLAAAEIRRADPAAKVVSASPYAQGPNNTWLRRYLATGAGSVVDALGVHLYAQVPEVALDGYATMRRAFNDLGLGAKPVWVTETGYRRNPGEGGYSDNAMRGIVLRSHLMLAAQGVARVYWYAWDNQGWVGVKMTQPDSRALAAGGVGYQQTVAALTGAKVLSCHAATTGLSSCTVSKNAKRSTYYWTSSGYRTMRLPAGTTGVQPFGGTWRPEWAGHNVLVTGLPVQVTLR
jgi:GH35 family endo-1,4-beta-xylanase